MLIIMHHRNIQLLFQFLFNIKTFRCFYIFQIDAAKCGFQRFYDLYKFFRIFFIDLNIEYINIGKYFKQYSFPSITGLPASGPISPKPRTAVPLLITATKFPFAVYL